MLEDLLLFAAHLPGIGLVVISEQMEQPVGKEQGDLIIGRMSQPRGSFAGMVGRDHHRPQRLVGQIPLQREAQYVGGTIGASVRAVEFSDGTLIAEDQFKILLRQRARD